jgi:hypothetical protein
MFKFLLAAFISVPLISFSQKTTATKKFRNEFSVVSDNDDYSFQFRDGYYTNGIYLKLSYASDLSTSKWFNKPTIIKVVNGIEIGQAIYNPYSFSYSQPQQQDRPFTGYLALTFDKHIFYKSNNVLELGASLGTIGPNSLGENVQRWYHGVIGIYDVRGWPTQLNNEVSLNLKASFVKPLITGDKEKRTFNIDAFAKAQLGNAFTNVSVGSLFRVGRIENNWNSSHWRARVSSSDGAAPVQHHEIYFFYQPSITLQVYNATLQGGMFINDKGPLTVDINPVVFTNQIGVRYAQSRWTTALIYIFRSKEAKRQIRSENLCSIQIAYRFKQ